MCVDYLTITLLYTFFWSHSRYYYHNYNCGDSDGGYHHRCLYDYYWVHFNEDATYIIIIILLFGIMKVIFGHLISEIIIIIDNNNTTTFCPNWLDFFSGPCIYQFIHQQKKLPFELVFAFPFRVIVFFHWFGFIFIHLDGFKCSILIASDIAHRYHLYPEH